MQERFKTFILLAQYRSFTETAKHLFCSQPTVSQHIQQLEGELKCKLIIRNKRQVELTTEGEIVLQYAKKMQLLEDELLLAVQQVNDQQNVNLFLSQYIAENYFEELFSKNYPLFNFEINSFCYDDLKCCLNENRAKFAVMPIYEADKIIQDQFDVDVLFEEELVLVMSKEHTLAHRQVLFTRDLKNLTILLPKSDFLNRKIRDEISEKKVAVNYVQMSNFEIIKKAIIQGLGVAFLPLKTIENNLDTFVYKRVKGILYIAK